jgi:hypothetical protein
MPQPGRPSFPSPFAKEKRPASAPSMGMGWYDGMGWCWYLGKGHFFENKNGKKTF